MLILLLAIILAFLPESASAVGIATITASTPGSTAMWSYIGTYLPYFGGGNVAPLIIGTIVINTVVSLIGGASVAIIIYSSIQMSLTGFSEESLTKGKKTITYAAMGLVFAILSEAIIIYVGAVASTMT
jgi:hypothetical protein